LVKKEKCNKTEPAMEYPTDLKNDTREAPSYIRRQTEGRDYQIGYQVF
jgi:hypothetical protein